MSTDKRLFDYLLRLADSDLVLAQRRLWFAYAGEVEARFAAAGRSEDALAFSRDGGEFRNLLLVEQPNGGYADTMARQFYFDVWHQLLLVKLKHSRDARIAEIAAKAEKEVVYHAERSADWIIRLGDGTAESHARMQTAIDDLWMYTGEMFDPDETETVLAEEGIGCDVRTLAPAWREAVGNVLSEATLTVPGGTWMQRGGKNGIHTEHLGHMLATMQWMQRTYPGAEW